MVIFNIRLPRIIIALLVGTALATAGTLLQGVTKNDLADSGILGINSGAALFVVVYIYFMNGDVYKGVNNFTIFTSRSVIWSIFNLYFSLEKWNKFFKANFNRYRNKYSIFISTYYIPIEIYYSRI